VGLWLGLREGGRCILNLNIIFSEREREREKEFWGETYRISNKNKEVGEVVQRAYIPIQN
jgi:hypothetical protein